MKRLSHQRCKTSVLSNVLIFALLALIAVSQLTACSKNGDPSNTQVYRLPWPDETSQYKLRDVRIETLGDPAKLSGAVARVYVDPYDSNGSLQGTPSARFIRSDSGVNVPADYDSMQGATVYAHLERLHKLDQMAGVADKIRWPLSVGVSTNVVDNKGSVNNNALYDGRRDALLFVPYSDGGLPISLNAGIIAHEHFHTVYQALVLSKVKEQQTIIGKPTTMLGEHSCAHAAELGTELAQVRKTVQSEKADARASTLIPKDIYNSYLLRAMNEGFADYWAWIYTGDVAFIGPSLSEKETKLRRLDSWSGQFASVVDLKVDLMNSKTGKVHGEAERAALSYFRGTQYARFLRQLTDQQVGAKATQEERLRIGKALMDSLPEISQQALKVFSDSELSPNLFLNPLLKRLPKVDKETCDLVNQVAAYEENFTLPSACAPAASSRSARKFGQ